MPEKPTNEPAAPAKGTGAVETVRVALGNRSYDILVGAGLGIGPRLAARPGTRVLIVSDANVDPLYGPAAENACRQAGLSCRRTVVPAGEETKTQRWLNHIYDEALAAGLDRKSFILALGGGVVGDLAGFAAATFLRGVGLVQAPTSLLAMVDSAVGGKTAINLPQGKNLVGAFYQPAEVVADLTTLKTLPRREYVSGLAEVVKYGVIMDANLFARLEASVHRLLAMDDGLLATVVARCCRLKAEVVHRDETESGPRAALNFGHTLAHALEQVDGYGTWLHGEAVAIGMACASRLSMALTGFPAAHHRRLIGLLRALGLPVARPGPPPPWTRFREALLADKKTVGAIPRFVLAQALGSVVVGREAPEPLVRAVLEEESAHVYGE